MKSHLQQHSKTGDQEHRNAQEENRPYTYVAPQHESLAGEPQLRYPAGIPHALNAGNRFSSSPLDQGATKRSSPIAISRPNDVKPVEVGALESDDDDDDSVIDVVERDAIRLRKRYGEKVVATAASYHPGMTEETYSSILSKTLLKAPYLGSLSKSENFLSSLPPMSLSTEDERRYKFDDGPPAEIVSYGSLRESHQRGKFLDGPSSYREPRSGQIRKLDYKSQQGGGLSKSHQPTVSIGERIQQAQKLKAAQHQNRKNNATGEASITSGLSMMMNEASKHSPPPERKPEPAQLYHHEASATTTTRIGTSFYDPYETEDYDKFDPPNMMSTSMTAFEILSTATRQRNHTGRFVQERIEKEKIVAGTKQSGTSSPFSGSESTDRRFQPLSRSMSDPTPHHLQRSPMLSPTLQQLQLQPPQSINSTLLGAPALVGGSAPAYYYNMNQPEAITQHASSLTGAIIPPFQANSPDIDAAFDMDLE